MFADPLTDRIAAFLIEIGLSIRPGTVTDQCFLPGIGIADGTLIVDEARLAYPGDVLHEAGHFAVADPERRVQLHGNVAIADSDKAGAEEMMAIAWSYAAAVHIGIDPQIVFHDGGYRGGSEAILAAFRDHGGFGIPMLQYHDMAYEPRFAAEQGVKPFPHMLRWLRGT